MLVSDEEKIVKKARHLASQAREKEIHYEHKELGYNYRMSNLLAAIGRGQLNVLDERVNIRREIYQRYFNALSPIEGIIFMAEEYHSRVNRWLTTLLIDHDKTGIKRNDIIKALEVENIESRPVWKPMHLQPFFKGYEYVKNNNEDISGRLFENGICQPSGSNLSETEQNRIIDIILSLLRS